MVHEAPSGRRPVVPFVVVGERGTGGELPVTLLSYARDICRGINFPSAREKEDFARKIGD